MRRTVSALLLLVYGLAVAAVTIFPIRPHQASYWAASPWWTMIHYIPLMVDAASFVLNIVMFVPLGLLLPVLWPRFDSVRRLAAYAAAASLSIELTQLVLGLTVGSRRTVDINDLIANTAGALAGLLVLRVAVPDSRHRASFASRDAAVSPGLDPVDPHDAAVSRGLGPAARSHDVNSGVGSPGADSGAGSNGTDSAIGSPSADAQGPRWSP